MEVVSAIPGSIPDFIALALLIILPSYFWNYAPPIHGSDPIFRDLWTNLRLFVPISLVVGIFAWAIAGAARAPQTEHHRRAGALRVFALGMLAAFPFVLGGDIIAERLFDIQGLGSLFTYSVADRDAPTAQFLLFAFLSAAVLVRYAMMYGTRRALSPVLRSDGQEHVVVRARSGKLLVTAGVVLGVFVVLGIAGPYLAPHDPAQLDRAASYAKPSWSHLFGANKFGQDTLSRVLYGFRSELRFGAVVTFAGFLPGALTGAILTRIGGGFWRAAISLCDTLLGLAILPLILGLVFAWGPGLDTVAYALAGLAFVAAVRITLIETRRGDVTDGVSGPLRQSMRVAGTSVLAELTSVLATAFVLAGTADLLGVGGFGLGNPHWASDVGGGLQVVTERPHLVIFPGAALLLTVLALRSVGIALDHRLIPPAKNENDLVA